MEQIAKLGKRWTQTYNQETTLLMIKSQAT